MVLSQYDIFRQYLSPWLNGPAADALINSLADEGYKGEQLSVAVNDQLSICTSSSTYLDLRLSQVNITRPSEIGISDDAFQQLGITINALQQVTTVIHDVLEIFYGPAAVRAVAQSGTAEPYALQDQDILTLILESGVPITITFQSQDFVNINQATAQEIANVITQTLISNGVVNGLSQAYTDLSSGNTYVQIFGGAKGPYSFVQVTGGQVQNVLQFPVIRDTNLPSNTTVWQVTRNVGQTIRFRWDGGPAPLLENVFVGDQVMIYGQQFESLGLGGTFTVTNVSPPDNGIQYDFGWFEVTIDGLTTLASSTPNIAPPSNTPSITYSFTVTQALLSDLNFFLPYTNTAYSKTRYALAFEPANNLLKIYLPATTSVVQRSLIGASYIHMLYPDTDFNGTFGSSTNQSEQLQIINDFCFKFPEIRLDNRGTGGTVTYGSTTVPIDYIFRENDFVTVVCTNPHGLVGYNEWSNTINYAVGATAIRDGLNYQALQASGPGNGGAQDPLISVGYWEQVGFAIDYCSTVVSITVANVLADDLNEPYPGPYIADYDATFTLTGNVVTSRQAIVAGQNMPTLAVSGTLPASSGILLFNLSQNNQEEPVPFIATQLQGTPSSQPIKTISQNGFTIVITTPAPHGLVPGDTVTIAGAAPMNGNYTVALVPSATTFSVTSLTSQVAYATTGTYLLVPAGPITTLILDPAYQFKQSHSIGADITLLSSNNIYVPSVDGTDYPLFLTSTAEARNYCQNIIEQITALGINLQIVIVYPDSRGLGNSGDSENLNGPPPYDEAASFVWAADDSSV